MSIDHDDERKTMADGWTDPDHPFDWLPPPDTDVAETAMDSIDHDPDILRRAEKPPPSVSSMPPPEYEALQQMLNDAFNREMMLRAELVRVRRLRASG